MRNDGRLKPDALEPRHIELDVTRSRGEIPALAADQIAYQELLSWRLAHKDGIVVPAAPKQRDFSSPYFSKGKT